MLLGSGKKLHEINGQLGRALYNRSRNKRRYERKKCRGQRWVIELEVYEVKRKQMHLISVNQQKAVILKVMK